ncbi:hypothetical protein AYO41_03075 [Verrucomicrobia bacterium SCGC AG-212-E04]|nr:hypothetical protein AYO41_03075 [Verrucomicrobia bacterium SCGC AG-212-E04]
MSKTNKTLIIGAAMAGLVLGSAPVQAAQSTASDVGVVATDYAKKKDVHSCKGKNSCKGNGGCKTGDNGCKGKNSCKGKGGCSTEPKK